MRRRHGEEYEAYRRSAPFLFPVPRFVEKVFALPFRILFRKERAERPREVVTVLALWLFFLMAISALTYEGGWKRMAAALRSEQGREAYLAGVVAEVRQEPNWRRQSDLTRSLGEMGEPGVGSLLELLSDQDAGIRSYAAGTLTAFPSPAAFDALVDALADPDENVRSRAVQALGALGVPEAVEPLVPLLSDSVSHIRLGALGILAELGAEEALPVAEELAWAPEVWIRSRAMDALGALGSPEGLSAAITCLNDEDPQVRRHAVIALLRIGSAEARPALEGVLGDEDREVRTYAAEALKRLPREGDG
jgi:HEAT repeat protein